MTKHYTMALLVCAVLVFAGAAQAQTFNSSGTAQVSVNIGSEASLSINGNTLLQNTGTVFGTDYTGTTSFVYKIRTAKTGGSGTIQLAVSTDFAPTGGPSVWSAQNGDTLAYSCTVSSPGTGCSGSVTSAQAATSVATFGTDARSAKAGNAGSVAWTLTNDPAYSTGSYQATVTFTIAAV